VTRFEYLHAYELAKKGRLRMIACARSEVMEALKNNNREEFEDFNFTSQFITEIKREEELTKATEGAGSFPIGNWLRTFNEFRDLTEALRTSLGFSKPLRRKAIEANLLWELKSNLQILLEKRGAIVIPASERLVKWRESVTISTKTLEEAVEITTDQAKELAWCGVGVLFGQWGFLATSALEDAVNSGEFLDYDTSKSDFNVGEVQYCLLRLRDELRKLSKTEATGEELRDRAIATISVIHKMTCPRIATSELVVILHVANIVHNVLSLTAALAAYLSGINPELKSWELAPETPLPESAKNFQENRPTRMEIDAWLNKFYGGKR